MYCSCVYVEWGNFVGLYIYFRFHRQNEYGWISV